MSHSDVHKTKHRESHERQIMAENTQTTSSSEGECQCCYRVAFLSVFLFVCVCVCHWILFQDFQVLTQTLAHQPIP